MVDTSVIIVAVISAVGGGGFLTGLYMLLKLRPEAGQITVNAAQGAVIVQSGVIKDLRDELKRVSDELEREKTEKKALLLKLEEIETKLANLLARTKSIEKNQPIN